jgi:hypothetical protein
MLPRRARGFTLIEVVIAAGILIAVAVGAAMVLTLTLNSLARSRQRAIALVLARARLETLVSVGSASGLSPPDALTVSREGFVDYLDEQGQPVAAAAAAFVRRWAIARSGAGASELTIVQVMVRTRGDRDAVWISGARLARADGSGEGSDP